MLPSRQPNDLRISCRRYRKSGGFFLLASVRLFAVFLPSTLPDRGGQNLRVDIPELQEQSGLQQHHNVAQGPPPPDGIGQDGQEQRKDCRVDQDERPAPIELRRHTRRPRRSRRAE